MRCTVVGGVLLAAAIGATACGTSAGGEPKRELTVYAAASLTESFGALERRFEAEHPGIDVKINYAGSSRLAQQLGEGARADVFASADEPNMDKVVKAGGTDGAPAVFATNRLTIAVAPGNPKGLTSFADLARAGLTVVACAPQVPCGAATGKIKQRTGVALKPASEEQDVKAVLTKVQVGEADAGLVYVTDVRSAGGKVASVDFGEAATAVNNYPIAVLRNASEPELARRFADYVRGEPGRQELTKVGFAAP